MTEPHDITTVRLRPPLGMDKPRTLADYQGNVIARFGCLPSFAELARIENTARRHRQEARPAALTPQGVEALRAARIKAAEATDMQVLAAVRETGSTTQDVATASGRAENVARHALFRLHTAGRVTCVKLKRATVWTPVEVAAE
jgi:hypothetical protein